MNTKRKIIFRLHAYTDAAGKFNASAPLDGNEDNFYVDDDLGDDIPEHCLPDQNVEMSDCGCLMVVADGMGGMNAGEVASQIAIDTVRDFFAPGKIEASKAVSPEKRACYLEEVIKAADRNIKIAAQENPAYEGMGSTLILAWIVGHKMTLGWIGDSRVYRYNPVNGLDLLSCDHSYVQELVNHGALSYEDTFAHPQGNIITRSLGDSKPPQPETRQFGVYNGDIILVCSDGLNGVLRDKKTKTPQGDYYPGETIEDIIAAHTDSLTDCRKALMRAAEEADWYDNVTVLLCQILSGAPQVRKRNRRFPIRKKNYVALFVSIVLLCGMGSYHLYKKISNTEITESTPTEISKTDSTQRKVALPLPGSKPEKKHDSNKEECAPEDTILLQEDVLTHLRKQKKVKDTIKNLL